MTRDEIMAMDGDALRLAVAKALGWRRVYKGSGFIVSLSPKGEEELLPDWPRDIAAAWELMEEMRNAELNVTIYHAVGVDGWIVSLDYMDNFAYYGETAPIAICRAWLAWKGGAK